MRQQDIRFGRATVVVDQRGGWALPGGKRTEKRLEAMAVAAGIDAILTAKAERVAEPEPTPLVISRRRAESPRLIHSRT